MSTMERREVDGEQKITFGLFFIGERSYFFFFFLSERRGVRDPRQTTERSRGVSFGLMSKWPRQR